MVHIETMKVNQMEYVYWSRMLLVDTCGSSTVLGLFMLQRKCGPHFIITVKVLTEIQRQ